MYGVANRGGIGLAFRSFSWSKPYGLIGLAICIAVWWATSAFGASAIPSPLDAFNALISMTANGSIIQHLAASLYRVGVGFLIGSGLAYALVCMFWRHPRLHDVFGLSIELLRPIPPVAFIPIVIALAGLGDVPAIILVSYASFFPTYTAARTAFVLVPDDAIDAARLLGASNLQILRYVIMPASLPAVGAGIRTSAGIAWFVVIVAELVGAQTGLGYLIQESRLLFSLDRAIAAMAVIAGAGWVIQQVVDFLIRSAVPWADSRASTR